MNDSGETQDVTARRLAAKIHAEPLQTLLALRQDLEERTTLDEDSLMRTRSHLVRAIRELRDVVRDSALIQAEHVDLATALSALGNDIAERWGTEVRIRVAPEAESATHRDTLWTSARELITNSAKHARAMLITADVRLVPGEVVLTVRDDGYGFPAARRRHAIAAGHVGLALIAQQVAAAGGSFTIDGEVVGGGTLAEVRLPLRQACSSS